MDGVHLKSIGADFTLPAGGDAYYYGRLVEGGFDFSGMDFGDIFGDLFGGGGSTLIYCEQTGRKCYMMELDPYYCQVILNRYSSYTGNEPVKIV